MRIERDAMGEKEVPDEAWYGIHTARALENFKITGETMPREIIYAIVKLKWATAIANRDTGMIPEEKSRAIIDACRRVLAGEFDDQFPVDVIQSGSGTSTNMNVNEVIANIANESLGGKRGARAPIHPHDDVNLGTSTNNVFPSAIKVALNELSLHLHHALRKLVEELRAKQQAYANVLKCGRTHLQDAVPMTVGQEIGAWARAIEKDRHRLESARLKLRELGIGGNAIGTGLNTKREFRTYLIRAISTIDKVAYENAEDGIEITQFLTDLAEYSAALRHIAVDLHKICNDIRLLASGPGTGLNEISLPQLEPGSSIMPGKFNPSACEAVNMVCLQVMGWDTAVAMACSAGQLELNTHMPLIAYDLIKGTKWLTNACLLLVEKCLAGLTVNREVCARHLENSLGIATVLNPRLGYDRVAELVREARERQMTIRQVVLEKGLMTNEEFDQLLQKSTGPNL